MRPRSALLAAAAAALMTFPATAGPAVAAEPAVGSCVIHLAPLAKGQTTSTVIEETCSAPGQPAPRLDAMSAAAASSVVIGIEYQDASFGGATQTYLGSQSCTSGAVYSYATLAAGWDNVISSARTYQGCQSRHYDVTLFGGSSHLCGCAGMGTMNNRTSSIRFS